MQTRQHCPELWANVERQAVELPQIYGGIDFSTPPERFTTGLRGETLPGFDAMTPEVLADEALVEMMAAYTLTGDSVADAYAARMTDFKFRHLIDMLTRACDHGLAAVPDAPPELAPFLAAMERTPEWLDMALVNQGAQLERNQFAHLVPFAIRGAFLATFMNRYSALPMALTGNLSDKLAAKRVHETATFFTLSVMPGALERHGAAFKAAAMVRLMHAMVRFNVMRHEGLWDARIYGVPIPQVDQMPAGQMGSFLIAAKAVREGRNSFTHEERARIELGRYRCFLLGLPEALLGDTPQSILRLMQARQATLRKSFDDATCGMLIRGTLKAELAHDASPRGRIDRLLERSFAKAFFIREFLGGDLQRARDIGVHCTPLDQALALLAVSHIYSRLYLFDAIATVPVLRDMTDRHLVNKLSRLLKRYGHAEFASDSAGYHASHG